jgi:hypothetical protein
MFELKKLSQEGVAAALAKVERYRLLNEPWEAESICLDVLAVEPENQQALVMLLLARTDQLGNERGATVEDARALLPRLKSDYERAYYSGIICERRARAFLARPQAGSGTVAYQWFRQAMEHYEDAERLRPAGNDNALLRWNTCARAIMRHPNVRPEEGHPVPQLLE